MTAIAKSAAKVNTTPPVSATKSVHRVPVIPAGNENR
jgi:hypothetical protein